MNCREVQARLSGYIDNTLGARETWEVDRHVAGCTACERERVELQRTVDALQRAPRVTAPDDFAARLQGRLRDVEPLPARRAWLTSLRPLVAPRAVPALGLAGAACLAVVLLTAGGPRRPESPVGVVDAQAAAMQHVAAAASDPLQDVTVANLRVLAAGDAAGSVVAD